MIDWLRNKLEGRSRKWPQARKEALKKSPFCAACHDLKDLQVHHIIPFRLRPDLELDQENLIVLCKHCHFTFGHYNDFRYYNNGVFSDVMLFSMRMNLNKKKFSD